MTIIAWDGVTMAGDRAMWDGNICVPSCKVERLPGSHLSFLKGPVLVGGCGSGWFARRVITWIEKGGERPPCPDDSKQSDVLLIVDSRRRIYRLSCLTLDATPVQARRTAFGAPAGVGPALAAMEFGASARQAVEWCIKNTDIAGLGVDVVRF